MKCGPRRRARVANEAVEFGEVGGAHVQWTTVLAVGLMAAGLVAGALAGTLTRETRVQAIAQGTPETDLQYLGGSLGIATFLALLATLLLGWAWTGVPLMGRWRRHRVEVHNWLSLAILAAAFLHTVQFVAYGDLRGWISGTLSDVLLLALFATGWWRADWVRLWGRPTWRVVHWELSLGAIALAGWHWFVIEHYNELLGIKG